MVTQARKWFRSGFVTCTPVVVVVVIVSRLMGAVGERFVVSFAVDGEGQGYTLYGLEPVVSNQPLRPPINSPARLTIYGERPRAPHGGEPKRPETYETGSSDPMRIVTDDRRQRPM
uniref:Uncharacterized protein n=1 Tax=Anopheles farauti TaxID=69004 RepID=A0A182Q0V2_9DIPT